MIQKLKKIKDCIPEILLLIWFISTFIMTLMIARDLSLERYLLPFLVSIIFIASYGFWNFIKSISNNKTKIIFTTCFLIAHAVTSMSYWQKFYLSPGTFWTNPIAYGTLQESLANPFTLFVNTIFTVFFVYLVVIRFQGSAKLQREPTKMD
jgi:hypothetical protein